ncbi:hypothetical protein BJY16_005806 [Actinoplanes octamycinicus]|uniref:Uncharacterized protein n=1 Tax=Actinoplanes octamycinicus TaxID=135948 RepID=A0A7W7H1W0_9ACTN|nr:hypothetical protein [Actinoplanes octamycinicus]MBB4742347.1 hypothetical protein [Actinoplanes octamycinicus]
MSGRPVWLLDVDGVVNAYYAGWRREPHVVQVWSAADQYSYRIRWEPRVVDAINRIHHDRLAEVRWCSTWCTDIQNLQDALAAGPFRTAFPARANDLSWAEMKARAALEVLGSGRPLVWTDDEEIGAARERHPRLGDAERDGRALLVAPSGSCGLRPRDIRRIAAFLGAV